MTTDNNHRYDVERVKNYVMSVNWSKRLDKEIPFLTNLFNNHNFTEILDFGCGPGIHATYIAKMYEKFHITGFDIDENMLAYAKEHSISEKLPNLSFLQGNFLGSDSDSLDPLKEKFDVVYSLGNALMIIWSNNDLPIVEIFKKLSYFIKPRGGLFFQILNSDHPRNGFIVSKISKTENGENQIQVKHFKPVEEKLLTSFSIFKWQSDGSEMKISDASDGFLKLVPLEELKKDMEKAGFSNFTFYENYDGKPLQSDSDALMCFAIKK